MELFSFGASEFKWVNMPKFRISASSIIVQKPQITSFRIAIGIDITSQIHNVSARVLHTHTHSHAIEPMTLLSSSLSSPSFSASPILLLQMNFIVNLYSKWYICRSVRFSFCSSVIISDCLRLISATEPIYTRIHLRVYERISVYQ